MTSIELTAPAKVNLFLKVLKKRKDSYHDILTVFERISLADKIKISKSPKGIHVSSDKFITRSAKDNLVYKAAELALKRGKIDSGVKIRIKKMIPIGAGLGGGSSNAAAVLLGMNKLFGLKLKRGELMKLGASLGADVAFFILDSACALGEGKGERLRAINVKKPFWHLLVYPGLRISTKEIYAAFDEIAEKLSLRGVASPKGEANSRSNPFDFALTTNFRDVRIHFPLRGSMGTSTELGIHPERCRGMDFGAAEAMLYNDLEDVVRSKKSVIGNIIKRLAFSLGKKAIVSGSGSSIFCLYRTRKEAFRAKSKFLNGMTARERAGWEVFVTGTL